MTLLLPIELTNGNEGRSKHWGSAAKRRREYEGVIRLLRPNPLPLATPVGLTLVRVLGRGQRLYDVDSLGRGNAKELVDAIVAAGFDVTGLHNTRRTLVPPPCTPHLRGVAIRH